MAKRHAPTHTLLSADVLYISRVTVSLATGLRKHLVGVEQSEEAFLKVLRAIHPTAVELQMEAHTNTYNIKNG